MHCPKLPHYNDEASFHRRMPRGMSHRILKFILIFISAIAIGLFYNSPVLAQDIQAVLAHPLLAKIAVLTMILFGHWTQLPTG